MIFARNENVLRLKCRGKSFSFSTHAKMFHEVSKAPWRLCLCYNVYPTQTIPYRMGWFPKMKYKIQLFTRSRNLPDLTEQVYFIFLSSADNLCKQFGPRSAPTECLSWSGFYWSWSWSKVFDTLALMFMKKIEKANFEKKKKSADGNKCMTNHQVCK